MATAEDTHIMPSHFSWEIHANDSNAWFRKFQNYCEYNRLTAAKALALFKVLMVGSVANWLETLGENVRGIFPHYKERLTRDIKHRRLLNIKQRKRFLIDVNKREKM